MNWQAYLFLTLFLNIVVTALIKIFSDRTAQRAAGVAYQYFWCAALSLAYGFVWNDSRLVTFKFSVFIAGFAGAFANYFFWKANHLNVTKTSLFLPLSDILTVVLALIFLGEGRELHFLQAAGIVLCFLSMFLFHYQKNSEKAGLEWLWVITGLVVIQGIVSFFLKIFSEEVSHEAFLANWYVGGFLGAVFLSTLLRESLFSIRFSKVLFLFPLGLSIVVSLLALYRSLELGGLVTIVFPVKDMGSALLSIFLGLVVFQEFRKFKKQEYLAFALGILGVFFIFLPRFF